MPTDDFRRATLPLFAEGLVEGLQWSFDAVDEIDWSIALLDAYEEAGRLSGHGVHLGMLSGERGAATHEFPSTGDSRPPVTSNPAPLSRFPLLARR
jgi:hypothetical protein